MSYRLQEYTMDATRTLYHARGAVDRLGGSEVAAEHLVLALFEADVSSVGSLQAQIRRLVGTGACPTVRDLSLSGECRRLLMVAEQEAERRVGGRVNSDDILAAVLLAETPLGQVMRDSGFQLDAARRAAGRERP
jgi:ATP-dependent Clp protease ATP-binding subunit ClpA